MLDRRRTPLRLDRANASVALVLVLVFVARWLLADRNSYWLDELLSVTTYGVDYPTLSRAVRRLSKGSIHPPLYQIVLYGWMKAFGHTELATRTLSNLYVTGASLCMFVALRKAVGFRRGLMATLFFSLMFVPFFFALETRSYAQSMFLSSVSTLVLFDFLSMQAQAQSWKSALLHRSSVLMALANFGLLMTHYFNAFFLGAQGIFALCWIAWRAWPSQRSARAWLALLARVALPLTLPLGLLAAAWGRSMKRAYEGQGSTIMSKTVSVDPLSWFWAKILAPNFGAVPAVILVVLALALLALYAGQARGALRGRRSPRFGKASVACYALAIAVGAFIVGWTLLPSAAYEFEARYFSFTAPALAILLVLALEQLVLLADRVTHGRAARAYLKRSTLGALAGLLLVLPGTYRAATTPKTDWRGVARLIGDVMGADPEHKYVLYSTGYTDYPSLDYYFKRLGVKTKVSGFLREKDDKKSRKVLKGQRKKIEKNDFLIVSFTHLPPKRFPGTLKALSARYEVHQSLLRDGAGIMIYRVKPRASATPL